MKLKIYKMKIEVVLSGFFVLIFNWYVQAQCNNDPGTIKGMKYFIGQSSKHDLSDTIFLCWKDRFEIDHNGDYDVSSDPEPATPAGIGYGWYKTPPTVSGDNLTAIKTDDIFRFAGDPDMMIFVDNLNGDAVFQNDFVSGSNSFNQVVSPPGNPTLIYYAPMTIDQRKANRGYHENGGPCVKVNINETFPTVYLNPITISDFQYNVNGDTLQASFVVKGGLPEFYKFHDNKTIPYTSIDVYDKYNTSPAYRGTVLTQNFSHGDRVVVKFPRYGEYKVIISDAVSCLNSNAFNITKETSPTFVLDTVSSQQGNIRCVTLSVRNLINTVYAFGGIKYDPNVLQYIGIGDTLYKGGEYQIQEYPKNPGTLFFEWTGVIPPPADKTTKLIKICFKLIGKVGECSPITMFNFQLPDDNNGEVYPYYEQGQICIEPPPGLYVSYTYCGSENNKPESSIQFKIFHGTPPYSYTLKDNGGSTVEAGIVALDKTEVVIVDLYPGNYHLEVTDDTGEFLDTLLVITQSPPLEFESISVKNPDCFGDPSGSIVVKVKDGDFLKHSLKWSTNVFNVDTLDNLENGTYGVTIVDENTGCQTDTFIIVNTSKLNLDLELIDSASCKGINNGSLKATVTGGTPLSGSGYEFRWASQNDEFYENSPMVSIFSNAAPGMVYISVHDSLKWCKETDSVFVGIKYTMELTSTAQDPLCYGSESGTITYDANLIGKDNDTFNLEFPVFPHPPFSHVQKLGADRIIMSDLGEGRYIVRIYEEATGCFEYDTVQLKNPPPLDIKVDAGKAGCDESSLPRAKFNIRGGVQPYTLTGIGQTVTVNEGQDHYYNDLPIGVYSVDITDSNGCDTTVVFEIVRYEGLLNIDTIKYDLLGCDATATTDIVVEASSSNGTIIYKWTDTLGINLGSTTNTLSNVGAGTYIVTLKDNLCTIIDTIVIPEAKPFTYSTQTTPAECGPGETGGFGGSVCVNIDGGDAGITYNWNIGLTGKCLNDVPAGDYTVTISDNAGCVSVDTIEVPGAPPIEIELLDVKGISCNDGQHKDGSAIIRASGGNNITGLFDFIIDGGNNKYGNIVTLTGLPGGVNHFDVEYKTSNGNTCTKSDSFVIAIPDKLTLDLLKTKLFPPTCNGDCDGKIIAKAKGGNDASYFYRWQETGDKSAVELNLCAGTYHIELTDANLCTSIDSVVLPEPNELVVEIDSANTKDVNCSGVNSGQISISYSGGNTDGPYTFVWDPDVSNTKLAENLSQGVYTVTVSDHKGCSDFASYRVKGQQPILVDSITFEEIKCYGDPTCLNIGKVSGGAGPEYTFSVNGGGILPVDSCKQLYASEQPYLISVFDSEGCKTEREVLISQPDEISVDLGDELKLDLGDPQTIHLNTNTNIKEVIWDIDTINFKYHFLNDLKTDIELEGYANDTIYATVIDQNGCSAEGALFIVVNTSRNVYIPNIFTPDGDGLNDDFRVTIGKGVKNINYMKIYNRWGELMYFEQNLSPSAANSVGWDGRYKGKKVNSGVYVYLIEVQFLDRRVILYRGSITVVR